MQPLCDANLNSLPPYTRIIVLRKNGPPLDSALVLSQVLSLSPPPPVSLVPVSIPSSRVKISNVDASFVAAAVLFGVAAGTVCNFGTQLKFYCHYDDALDVRYSSLSLPANLLAQVHPRVVDLRRPCCWRYRWQPSYRSFRPKEHCRFGRQCPHSRRMARPQLQAARNPSR